MARKTLGATAVEIPAVGFGTWRYSGGVVPLVAAIELGAAFIDTAETYGSEETVGKAIRGRRKEVFVATKVRPAHFRQADVFKAAEDSLRRLGTDYIDLYQLHWPNYIVPIEETMSAMEKLVEAGKVRFIGVSNFSAQEIGAAQRALGRSRIVSNQVRYSLIERTIEHGLLRYCQQEKITVIAFSPLGETFSVLREHDPEGVFSNLASKYKKSEAQIALNWLLENDNVVVIPKASTPAHVIDDCGACGWQLAPEDVRLLSDKIRFTRRGSVERLARRWGRMIVQRVGKSL